MSSKSRFWTIVVKIIVTLFSKLWDFIKDHHLCLYRTIFPDPVDIASFLIFWTKKVSRELTVMIYTGNKNYSPSFYAGN